MKRHELRALMALAGISPRRSSGQNFLVEENLADAIADDGGIGPDDVAFEIGTGFGILTTRLAARAHHVVTVDLDGKVLAVTRELLQDLDNVTILEADALANKNRLNPEVIDEVRRHLGEGRRLRIVSNLPYNVATSLVVLLLAEPDLPLASMVVMVQLEAAERFGAQVGDPKYGAVSILCDALCQRIDQVRRVPRDVFMPRPKVTSAVVRLIPHPERHTGFLELSAVVRALFNYRRKTLSKAIKAVRKRFPELDWLEEAVREAGVDPSIRCERLIVEDFRRIVQAPRGGSET